MRELNASRVQQMKPYLIDAIPHVEMTAVKRNATLGSLVVQKNAYPAAWRLPKAAVGVQTAAAPRLSEQSSASQAPRVECWEL